MSNVRIEAIGNVGLVVEARLGSNVRAKELVNAGEAVEMTVGGNQILVIDESAEAAPAPTTKEQDIPVGIDVTEPVEEEEPEQFDLFAPVSGFPAPEDD